MKMNILNKPARVEGVGGMVRVLLLASVASVFPVAFDTGGKWKVDADGKLVVDADGNPIYVKSDNSEQSVKGDTIATLNAEAKGHRTKAEQAEASLAKYKGADGKLLDPEIAVKAVDTVKNIDAKKLIDSGEVETLKAQLKDEFTVQINELKVTNEQLSSTNKNLLIDKQFDSSEFVAKRVAVPRDMFRDSFGKNVKIGDDGKPEFYGRDGNRLLSKKNAGEYATGDEAFELLVDQHPQKDTIIKALEGGGSGGGGGGGRGGGAVIRRVDFDKLPPAQQSEIAIKGETQIVD